MDIAAVTLMPGSVRLCWYCCAAETVTSNAGRHSLCQNK